MEIPYPSAVFIASGVAIGTHHGTRLTLDPGCSTTAVTTHRKRRTEDVVAGAGAGFGCCANPVQLHHQHHPGRNNIRRGLSVGADLF